MRRLVAALALATLAVPAAAQHRDRRGPEPTRWYAGGGLVLADARGPFGDYVNGAVGGSAHVLYQADPQGIVGLRMEGGVMVYGQERYRVPLSYSIGGRVTVDVSTTNNIAFFGIGPQIVLPGDGIRPYATGIIGGSYFFTESSVEGTRSDEEFASTTNFDDIVFSYSAGGGLFVPIRRGPMPIVVDLGVRYHRNPDVEYLREGSIEDNPDGTLSYYPIRSDADVLTFQVGVTARIGRSREWERDCRRCDDRDRDRRRRDGRGRRR